MQFNASSFLKFFSKLVRSLKFLKIPLHTIYVLNHVLRCLIMAVRPEHVALTDEFN
jgi:hypothetical protein